MFSHLIQLLLPVADNQGRAFPDDVLENVKSTLVEKFGGVTAFSRAPAQGVWAGPHRTQHDDVVIVEVMAGTMDETWWGNFRAGLERKLGQQEIVVRAFLMRTLE